MNEDVMRSTLEMIFLFSRANLEIFTRIDVAWNIFVLTQRRVNEAKAAGIQGVNL